MYVYESYAKKLVRCPPQSNCNHSSVVSHTLINLCSAAGVGVLVGNEMDRERTSLNGDGHYPVTASVTTPAKLWVGSKGQVWNERSDLTVPVYVSCFQTVKNRSPRSLFTEEKTRRKEFNRKCFFFFFNLTRVI